MYNIYSFINSDNSDKPNSNTIHITAYQAHMCLVVKKHFFFLLLGPLGKK